MSGEAGISIPSFSKDDSYDGEYYGDTKPKVGVPFGAEVHYKLSNNFSVGLNMSYRIHKIDQDTELDVQDEDGKDIKKKANINQKFHSTLFMLNGKYSIGDFYVVKPYIMAGIGIHYAVNGSYIESSSESNGKSS